MERGSQPVESAQFRLCFYRDHLMQRWRSHNQKQQEHSLLLVLIHLEKSTKEIHKKQESEHISVLEYLMRKYLPSSKQTLNFNLYSNCHWFLHWRQEVILPFYYFVKGSILKCFSFLLTPTTKNEIGEFEWIIDKNLQFQTQILIKNNFTNSFKFSSHMFFYKFWLKREKLLSVIGI